MKHIKDIEEFNAFFRQTTVHPLVSVGDLSGAHLSLFEPLDFGMYCVVLMDDDFGELVKNGNSINYRPGTVFVLRPGDVVSMRLDFTHHPQGWMLAFRPELLEKSGLGRDFYMFNFFQQEVLEALELSKAERGLILNCFANIFAELHTSSDYLTNHMLRLEIGQLLSYCKRFFERQFDELVKSRHSMRMRLDTMIDNYLSSGLPAQQGQPTVAWCASQFNLSPNYFGDLVRKELHVSAQEYVQHKIIEAAQMLLKSTQMTINEIAEELGFNYPNHFTRMFRKNTGLTPIQYRKSEHH